MRAEMPDRPETAQSTGAIASQLRKAARKGPPPVHLWDPPFCGDIDMRIAADGTWFYQGGPIGRRRMVKLFGSVLKREGDKHFLVTPVEKLGITVEDAPFLAVDLRREGDALVFTTNLDDEVAAGPDNPIRVAGAPATPRPYVHVRRGLEALIDRKTFYRMIDMGERRTHEGAAWFGVVSQDAFFPIAPADALEV